MVFDDGGGLLGRFNLYSLFLPFVVVACGVNFSPLMKMDDVVFRRDVCRPAWRNAARLESLGF